MTQKPAPLDLVRQKLDARKEEDRVVALLHAAAHGKAARSLAARVAAMLEDESTAVQWHAVGTFQSIGAEAIEAVPVLLALRAKGVPPVLVSRATFCLGCVGPSARNAVPPLKAALRQAPADRDVLQALWHSHRMTARLSMSSWPVHSHQISAFFSLRPTFSKAPRNSPSTASSGRSLHGHNPPIQTTTRRPQGCS